MERLWPRGVSKERAKIDIWCKDLSPSTELRKWHHSHIDRWNDFIERYLEELKDKKGTIEKLRKMSKQGTLTFVYATKDLKQNNAVVLKDIVEGRLKVK